MGIELILNSCNLNFAAFSRFVTPPNDISGQIISIFGIVLAAAEAARVFGNHFWQFIESLVQLVQMKPIP